MPHTYLLKKYTLKCKSESFLTGIDQAPAQHFLSPSYVPNVAGLIHSQSGECCQQGRKPVPGQSEGQLPSRETSWRQRHWSTLKDRQDSSDTWTRRGKEQLGKQKELSRLSLRECGSMCWSGDHILSSTGFRRETRTQK